MIVIITKSGTVRVILLFFMLVTVPIPATISQSVPVSTISEQDIPYHPDPDIRGEWQQNRIKDFCDRHGFGNLQYEHIPRPQSLERHIIRDDKSKNLFCYIPKVGCRTTRTILLVSTGKMSEDAIRVKQGKPPVEEDFRRAIAKTSFQGLTYKAKIDKLKSYGKYIVVRHPLERILSAFRDKIGGRLFGSEDFGYIKLEILKKYQPKEFSLHKTNKSIDIRVKFEEYIMWLLEQDFNDLNEHFTPQYHDSQPCVMRYDFYGNFDYFEKDFFVILNKFNIDGSAVLDKLPKGNINATVQKIDMSWSPLPLQLKHKLYKKYKIDFDFYHSLYPAERSMTNKYLELSERIE